MQNKDKAIVDAQDAAESLHNFPVEDVQYNGTRMDEYRPDLIEMVLEWLVPENMIYEVVSRRFQGQEGNEYERWYGTEFQKKKIDKVEYSDLVSNIASFN